MAIRLTALRDDTKSMVLHDGGAADAAQQALLHAALELNHRNLGARDFDFDGDFAERNPGNQDASKQG